MHEGKAHLPQAEQCPVTEPRNAPDGQRKGIADNMGSTAGQRTDRETSGQPRQSLWRKRRGQGQSVYARDKEERA